VPSLCFFTSFYASDLYNLRAIKTLLQFRKRLIKPLFAIFLLLVILPFVVQTPKILDSVLLSSGLFVLLGAGIVLPLRWGLHVFGNLTPFAERILIIGTGELARKIAAAIRALSNLGYTIAGFVDDGPPRQPNSSSPSLSPILGHLDRVEQIIEHFRPHRIIVALRERRGRMPLRALLRSHWAGVCVEDGITVLERFSGKLAVESLTPGFLIFSTDFRKPRLEMMVRRTVSLFVAIVGLVISAPLILMIALAIKIDSKGSIFFVQERAGLNGRIFPLVKFRTMVSSTPAQEICSVWNRDLNTRVTRVGQWLRKTHLDELPQFFNILQGHMDLVGPRPEIAANIQTMEKHIPYYALRMSVRPGVTGWAQVKYGYAVNQEDVTEKIRYDLYYIKHRSIWLDLKIMVDTVKLVILGRESLTPRSVSARPSYGGAVES
jgi:exopolysaccharide biosynthesis polyprenyl glycosylphosphotransferase